MVTAVILAGGLGTRLRSVVPDLPKPMATIRRRPFLEHLMDYWIGQGICRFILSVGYRRNVIMEHFGQSYCDVALEYAIEESPLGTGGGLLLAAERLTEPFVTLNGDSFFEVNLETLFSFHRSNNSLWTFALFRASEAGRYTGMDVAADGRILSLKSATGVHGRLANGGVYVIDPAALSATDFKCRTRVSLEDEMLPALAAMKCPLYGLECRGIFIDIGVPEDYVRAADLLP
jgi:D-glycero-alpha-D-manno-heptose 1-phosphate guanylyltransferase